MELIPLLLLYPVRKPRHLPRWIVNILQGLWRGWRKKYSFLIEGGGQSPALSNGVYQRWVVGI